MCLSIPGKIIAVNGNAAQVDVNGMVVTADITLLKNVIVGDYVLVHSGFAIQKYSVSEAEETLRLIKEVADVDKL
jgi:hydrogenase expression/formation protein HypC